MEEQVVVTLSKPEAEAVWHLIYNVLANSTPTSQPAGLDEACNWEQKRALLVDAMDTVLAVLGLQPIKRSSLTG